MKKHTAPSQEQEPARVRGLLLLEGLAATQAQQPRSSDRAALSMESALAEATSLFVAGMTETSESDDEKRPRTKKTKRETPAEATAEVTTTATEATSAETPGERRRKAQKTKTDAGGDGDNAAADGAFLERYARLGGVFGSSRRGGGEGRSDAPAAAPAPSTLDLLKDALALADLPIDDGLPAGALPHPHRCATPFLSPGAALHSSLSAMTTMPAATFLRPPAGPRRGRDGKGGPWGK